MLFYLASFVGVKCVIESVWEQTAGKNILTWDWESNTKQKKTARSNEDLNSVLFLPYSIVWALQGG
jgi:hypothetical protein